VILGFGLNSQNKRFCSPESQEIFLSAQSHSRVLGYYPAQKDIQHCAQDFDYSFSTDSYGLRGYGSSKAPRAVIALGDSFTFGYGIPDNKTFSYLLGAYNAGIFAAPFSEQIKTFDYIRKKVVADTIVWDIYPPHLITMTHSGWGTKCPGDIDFNLSLLRKSGNTSENHVTLDISKMLDFSNIFNLIASRAHIKSLILDNRTLQIRRDCYFTKEDILYSTAQVGDDQPQSLNTQIHQELEEAYKQLRDIVNTTTRNETVKIQKLFFVLIPSKLQLAISDSVRPDVDSQLAFKRITQILRDADVPESNIIDLTPVFANKQTRASLFFESDAHWNELGHQKVAEYIEIHIKK
jgi:hypothetical protein